MPNDWRVLFFYTQNGVNIDLGPIVHISGLIVHFIYVFSPYLCSVDNENIKTETNGRVYNRYDDSNNSK